LQFISFEVNVHLFKPGLDRIVYELKKHDKQGRINHCARGLALEYQNTSLLVFHVFMLFITRQNCRAF